MDNTLYLTDGVISTKRYGKGLFPGIPVFQPAPYLHKTIAPVGGVDAVLRAHPELALDLVSINGRGMNSLRYAAMTALRAVEKGRNVKNTMAYAPAVPGNTYPCGETVKFAINERYAPMVDALEA